jgi:hypothetical protein
MDASRYLVMSGLRRAIIRPKIMNETEATVVADGRVATDHGV